MADAGSRVWQSEEMARKFADMSFAWTQVTVPPNSRKLSKIWERCSELEL
ncbi:hypothetical protein PF003_g26280 [Phytophthora fragariae]|nr:hypothetical protein PF003_g26280 [Phytophthora fragariae]